MGMGGRPPGHPARAGTPNRYRYDELLPLLDTGDIVLCAGKSRFSRAIRRATRGKWSHAALVLRPVPGGEVYLWEGNATADMVDLDTGEMAPGPRRVVFLDWLRKYNDETAVRRLLVGRTPAMLGALAAFREEMRGRPYERRRLELARSVLEGPLGTNRQEDLSSVFCSELVAASYQRMGLLPARPPSNEYTPKDFSTGRRPRLRLLLGARLAAEAPLVW